MKKRLTPRELRILRLLSRGESYDKIRETMEITHQNLYSTCAIIRRKTGIGETRDHEECRKVLRVLHSTLVEQGEKPEALPPRSPAPFPCQLAVMRLVASGKKYKEIARLLNIQVQCAQNYASEGAKRAGIVGQGWKRNRLMKEWLEKHAPERPKSLMDDPAF